MRRYLIIGALVCNAVALATIVAPATNGVELPPEIQVDRLLVQAERESGDGEHWSAVITLRRALEIYEEHGLEIPADFWFRQAGRCRPLGSMSERSRQRPATCRRLVAKVNITKLH